MKSLCLLTLLVCSFLSFSTANAQILAWDYNGNAGSETSVNSTTTNANLNVSTISRGAGVLPSGLANSFSSDNFTLNAASLAEAVTNEDYIQFTVSPRSGFRVSLSALNANFRRSAQGPNAFQWQYSLDGFTTAGINIGSAISYTGNETNGAAQPQIDLSSISALQNVAFPNAVTFRLYGWGATASSGSFALGRLAGNDLAVTGTTEAVTTAATASITGRTISPAGRGIRNVTVMISGGNLPEPRFAMSNSFGYFSFTGIPVGENYVLSVMSKNWFFQQPSKFVSLTENLAGVDFIGEKNARRW